jgi:acyl-CoA dehydrogenase
MKPTSTRKRLCHGIYERAEPSNHPVLLQEALELAQQVEPVEQKISDAHRAGQIKSTTLHEQVNEAKERGILTEAEAIQIQKFDAKVMGLLAVDDFLSTDLVQTLTPATKKKKVSAKQKRTKKK